ncbi:type II toxin-antitoxin system HipA family toxin [Superficieibacter sp. BNK-5]|uniref:type II toxin-antitoxin system HipA family toxin n=1 Tax=Superficieibacter sp. BNK-5 TaxID=3376142 RepID=UPI0039BFD4E2
MERCRILLTPLNEGDARNGYSAQGLKRLGNGTLLLPRLAFSRNQFVQELPLEQRGMSISGYQPKLQMVLTEGVFNVVSHQGDYILKPSPADFPGLAENEHATMSLMSRLGFNVPPHGLVSFTPENTDDDVEYAFVIRRFDRDVAGQPIHQEQLDGAMGIMEKYGKTGNDGEQYVSYETIARFLIAHVNDNLAFRIDLFRRIVYAWLLGNNDMHLRNFGLLYADITPTLAPIYDFVSVAPYPQAWLSGYLALPLLTQEEGGHELAPGFDSVWGEYTGQDFLLLGSAMGLTTRLLDKLYADLRKESVAVEKTYSSSFMPPEHIQSVLACYHHRLRLLQHIG